MGNQTDIMKPGSIGPLLQIFNNVLLPENGQKPTIDVIRQRVLAQLNQAKSQGCITDIARQITCLLGLENFLPQRYQKFTIVVVEGLVFMLAELPLGRLANKIVDQICMSSSSSFGQRLCTLIQDMPTLQKLGQIICRSPGLDPEFKQALIDLEDNIHTINFDHLEQIAKKEATMFSDECELIMEKRILAEASVCAVIPAEAILMETEETLPAVLKMVKPAVRETLPGDLELWRRMALFLDRNRSDWGLGDFQFKNMFDEVRRLLENEVDLAAEQENLETVTTYYRSDSTTIVPRKLPASTPEMTVMSREEGRKITDVAHLTVKEKRRLAGALAKALILRPIQDLNETSIFHGDPHAGNLAYTFEGSRPKIILYDWAMMGRLHRMERFALVFLSFGLVTQSKLAVFYAADIITKGQISSDKTLSSKIMDVIEQVINNRTDRFRNILSSIETLIEAFTYQGVTFPADLLMYEKAMVTLKGVLADIDPTFERDDYIVWAAMRCFWDDLFKLRFHQLILREIWKLYRFSLCRFLDIQKLVFKVAWEFSHSRFNLPI